jgi:hypothetical protein
MANAGPDQRVEENTQVTLNGANSNDSDGDIGSFVWLQMAGPPVSLSDPTSPQPVFTAPIVGLADGFLPGDTLPGFVLQQRAAGSIADVAARGAYVNGQWTVMFTRTLTTLDPEADVQFDLSDAAHLYAFSIAYLDNTGAAPPRSAAAAVMATQDTAPYTLGNATSGADLQARRETPPDCNAFTGTPLVTTPADPAVVPSLTLQAAYDDVHLYLCVHAPDPNGIADEQPEHWEFLGPESTDWERKPNTINVMGGTPNAFDEDRIALWWNINAQDFATEGCFALCHDQRMQSRNADGRADLWHWKAGTTNRAGLAQDQGLSADPALCPEHPCRQSDSAAEAIAQPNVRRVDSLMLPAFIAADGAGVSVRTLFADEMPADCLDCAFAQSAAVFNDLLEFELTVTDDGGLSASDRVTVQIVETPTPTPSGGGGGGGGCAMMPGAQIDPTLLAALSLILAYLGWRRTRRG